MINHSEIYKWIRENIDLDSENEVIKQDLINGIAYKYNLTEEESKLVLEKFVLAKHDSDPLKTMEHEKYISKIRNIREDDSLIEWKEIETKKKTGRKMICHNCKKILENLENGEYCDLKCKEQYINNIILFWKPDIITEYNDKAQSIEVLQQESRLAFLTMIREAEPEELRLRIKVLKHVLREAYEIGYNILERDKLRTEHEQEFSSKEVSKRHSAERDRALVENAELKRELEAIKKSGEKINPETKKSIKTGKILTGVCKNCGKETLKETCSEKCKIEWRSVEAMMNLPGFDIERARAAIKKLNEQSIN